MSSDRPKHRGAAPRDPELFAAAVIELEAELDWELLGSLYCSEGGAGFFPPEQIEAQRECGLLFAADLAEALADAPLPSSLYLGAALAELVPALSEELVLGRRVVLVNLPGPEPRAINAALERVESRLGVGLPRILEGQLGELASEIAAPFGHAWMTSVLSDPEAFPALHDELYGRGPARESREEELGRARALVDELLDQLAFPARLTTSDEELALVDGACRERGLRLVVPAEARLSAIVGDALRICTVERS